MGPSQNCTAQGCLFLGQGESKLSMRAKTDFLKIGSGEEKGWSIGKAEMQETGACKKIGFQENDRRGPGFGGLAAAMW